MLPGIDMTLQILALKRKGQRRLLQVVKGTQRAPAGRQGNLTSSQAPLQQHAEELASHTTGKWRKEPNSMLNGIVPVIVQGPQRLLLSSQQGMHTAASSSMVHRDML